MRSFIHSFIALFLLTRSRTAVSLCMMYFVKNNRNKININKNYFTELSFPSSIHKIHKLPTKKATRTHNGGVYSVLICMYVYECICK